MEDIDFSKIKVVFFDVGGVMLSNGWGHESRQKAAEFFGFDYKEMDILHNFIFNVFEIGSISLDEYLDTVLFHCPRDFSKSDFKEFMFAQSVELPEMLNYLKNWKKKINVPVFAINNESKELNDFRIKKFKLHQVFDGFFSSCYLGMRKPNPQLFHKAIQFSQFSAEESLYFDDRPMLVKVANNLNMNAFLHESCDETEKILDKLIIK